MYLARRRPQSLAGFNPFADMADAILKPIAGAFASRQSVKAAHAQADAEKAAAKLALEQEKLQTQQAAIAASASSERTRTMLQIAGLVSAAALVGLIIYKRRRK